MNYETLTCQLDDAGILLVSIDNPPVNVMTQTTFVELRDVFTDWAKFADQVRAVILTGNGKHFAAGGDVEELRSIGSSDPDIKLRNIREAYWAVLDCPVPVIGALKGSALGGGAALAAVCDVLVAASGARIGLPELNVGVVGGAAHLMRILPQQFVRWMFLTGASVPVERVQPLGGVLEVVPEDELLDTARRLCHETTRFSRVAVEFAKRDLNVAEQTQLRSRYELEQQLTKELVNYADSWEAATAFIEQRPPSYRNDRSLRHG